MESHQFMSKPPFFYFNSTIQKLSYYKVGIKAKYIKFMNINEKKEKRRKYTKLVNKQLFPFIDGFLLLRKLVTPSFERSTDTASLVRRLTP